MKYILKTLKKLTISFLILSTVMANASVLTHDNATHIMPLGDNFYTNMTDLN